MKIAIAGGGPGGLYLAALMKTLDPAHEITVWERNAPDDTFGFGVVFSDETLGSIEGADTVVHDQMEGLFARWTDIDVDLNGHSFTVGGQGFAAMSRKDLLRVLQQRALDLDVDVRYRTEAPDVDELNAGYDLVVASDGLNSTIRSRRQQAFGPTLDRRPNKYIWFGTDLVFEAFQFFVKTTQWGVMQIHGYPYSDKGSTFIVEMHEDVWRRAGLDRTEAEVFPAGVSDTYAVERIGEIFAEELQGHQILTNNSKWLNFHTVRNERWYDGNVVLIGDAAHTAHFSIGSGTKLAMEDALALAACLHEHPSVDAALTAYEAERKPVVESTQRAAQASLEWFENIGMYADQDPAQFVFNLITRSRRITFDNLEERDSVFAARMEQEFARHQGSLRRRPRDVPTRDDRRARAQEPSHRLAHGHVRREGGCSRRLPSRSPGLQGDGRGRPGHDGDDVRLTRGPHHSWLSGAVERRTGSSVAQGDRLRALPQHREDRPAAGALRSEGLDQADVGGHGRAPGVRQLGSGRTLRDSLRARTVMCRGRRRAPTSRRSCSDFVDSARRGVHAGFDLVEVHAAHGYLLSSFLSPISNQRTDHYGGSLENRLRFPLEVFDAIREVVPAPIPVTVRISATDWAPGGNTDEDAVQIAQAFIEHGADAIDVSSGQVTKDEKPAFGRSYQTPFADKIRHRVAGPAGVKVIAVGAISSVRRRQHDPVGGRADFCALARPHLYDPNWTLHAAAEQDYEGPAAEWPDPWKAGRRRPPTSRTDKIPPRLSVLREGATQDVHVRWAPGRRSDPEAVEHVGQAPVGV